MLSFCSDKTTRDESHRKPGEQETLENKLSLQGLGSPDVARPVTFTTA